MTELAIRPAVPADVDALVALGARTFRATYREISDAAEIEDYVREYFTPSAVSGWISGARTLMAEAEGVPVGYAVLSRDEAPPCVAGPAPVKLWRLYLAEDGQGRGHGATLLQACLAEACTMGGRTLWLGVYDRNVRAVAFYERWGFRQVGTNDFEFGGRLYADPVMARAVG
jgi:ribosomal protein S18 acetylase RimI-like enzyme